MANIKARKSKDGRITSYQIRVFRGWDENGKQIMVTDTYKVDHRLTDKQNKDKAEAMAKELDSANSRSQQHLHDSRNVYSHVQRSQHKSQQDH